MGFALSIHTVEGVSIMTLSGRLTLGETASTLRMKLRETAARGQKKILLDLADVSFIDSSGLGVLVSSFATLASQGGQVKLLNLTKRVKDLLLITKLLTVFEVYEDEATAVRSFGKEAATVPV